MSECTLIVTCQTESCNDIIGNPLKTLVDPSITNFGLSASLAFARSLPWLQKREGRLTENEEGDLKSQLPVSPNPELASPYDKENEPSAFSYDWIEKSGRTVATAPLTTTVEPESDIKADLKRTYDANKLTPFPTASYENVQPASTYNADSPSTSEVNLAGEKVEPPQERYEVFKNPSYFGNQPMSEKLRGFPLVVGGGVSETPTTVSPTFNDVSVQDTTVVYVSEATSTWMTAFLLYSSFERIELRICSCLNDPGKSLQSSISSFQDQIWAFHYFLTALTKLRELEDSLPQEITLSCVDSSFEVFPVAKFAKIEGKTGYWSGYQNYDFAFDPRRLSIVRQGIPWLKKKLGERKELFAFAVSHKETMLNALHSVNRDYIPKTDVLWSIIYENGNIFTTKGEPTQGVRSIGKNGFCSRDKNFFGYDRKGSEAEKFSTTLPGPVIKKFDATSAVTRARPGWKKFFWAGKNTKSLYRRRRGSTKKYKNSK